MSDISQLGLGVLINMLGSNDSAQVVQTVIGKIISGLKVEDNELTIKFTDGTGILVRDEGQSCCEWRYMRTDDDLSRFVTTVFHGLETRRGGISETGRYGNIEESQFLLVHTNRGSFTVVNYNEHNGYYGGFSIRVHHLQ